MTQILTLHSSRYRIMIPNFCTSFGWVPLYYASSRRINMYQVQTFIELDSSTLLLILQNFISFAVNLFLLLAIFLCNWRLHHLISSFDFGNFFRTKWELVMAWLYPTSLYKFLTFWLLIATKAPLLIVITPILQNSHSPKCLKPLIRLNSSLV